MAARMFLILALSDGASSPASASTCPSPLPSATPISNGGSAGGAGVDTVGGLATGGGCDWRTRASTTLMTPSLPSLESAPGLLLRILSTFCRLTPEEQGKGVGVGIVN